jgi:hypothetical protein
MGLRLALFATLLTLAGLPPHAWADEAPKPSDAARAKFDKDIQPLLTTYCTGCHGGSRPRAGVALDLYKNEAGVIKDRAVWEKVLQILRAGDMPPKNKPKPTQAERDLLTAWLDSRLGLIDCSLNEGPGRVTIRRLNRVEYNNTIRDLVGIDFHPADDFPADDVGYGFDNIGDVLSMPPILMEKYLAAAEKIIDKVFRTPEAKERIFICQPADKNKRECARKIIQEFARRAYRRPATEDEIIRLLRFVEQAERNGDGFEQGIRLACTAVLVSPNFLFKVELDPNPRDTTSPIRTLNDYELATRLSYFLWSTMPDEELFRLAKEGALRKDDNLEVQVQRMLHHPKAVALVENFAGQWLQTRNLRNVTPDTGRFPDWDDELRTAMLRETELFFAAVMKEDNSVLDFLDADYTFLNERLAKHYGIDGINGDEFRRVQLKGGQRGGVLTQASILTITSNPTRTSPVKRGKWILENILGTPPPPPPPDVPELKEDKDTVLTGSLRQRMEQHRANPSCAVCHNRMDALGFGFENFDAVGAWRTRDANFDIDPSGVLPSGQSFKGPAELKAILKGQKDLFARCLSEKMLTYALGRGLEYYDRCAVDQIAGALAENDYRFSTLILAVVKSEPFQMRRGKRGDK